MSSIVSADALRVISEVIEQPLHAPIERSTRPYWLTTPCPSWCTETHSDRSFYEDRVHTATPGYPMDLTLYREQVSADTTGPATIDASLCQHYRESEPTISLTVPKHDGDRRTVDGESDIEMTPAEVRALRDRLTLILAMVDGAPLDVELGESVDGASRRTVEHVTRLEHPYLYDVDITSHLTQWVEPGSGPELEVSIDVASNPTGCTPNQARSIAAQLREAADHIERLADYAEKTNATIGGTK